MKANENTKNMLMYRCSVCGELDTIVSIDKDTYVCYECGQIYSIEKESNYTGGREIEIPDDCIVIDWEEE